MLAVPFSEKPGGSFATQTGGGGSGGGTPSLHCCCYRSLTMSDLQGEREMEPIKAGRSNSVIGRSVAM